jgi:lipoprotein-anchoring transpeptidase ErfK/SrfK
MTSENDLRLLEQAKSALRRGDRMLSRRIAQHLVQKNPDDIEGWLLLGGLSSPKASLAYLKKAEEIDPGDPRVREALIWAQGRLDDVTQRIDLERTREIRLFQPSPMPSFKLPAPVTVQTQSPVWVGTLVVVLMLALFFFGMDLLPSGIVRAAEKAGPIRQEEFTKPSLTPTVTNTPTPTNTPTATPTSTPTPTPTSTPTPTLVPTQVPQTNPIPNVGDDEKWIDVDLSSQMLYAYEGDTIVRSFLVSTGTYLHPTVVGQFAVWTKLRYTDMSGPGYYLPDVPYTMYFYQGYGIHGTYWHDNFGTPMSHGCVNMRTEEAGWLFNWAYVGILVNVHE